jgi:hypothetical protein
MPGDVKIEIGVHEQTRRVIEHLGRRFRRHDEHIYEGEQAEQRPYPEHGIQPVADQSPPQRVRGPDASDFITFNFFH